MILFTQSYAALDYKKTNSTGTTFLKTMMLSEFEQKYSEISIEKKKDEKHYAYFLIEGNKQLISIDGKLKPEMFHEKESLSISMCRDSEDKTFWLLHKRNKRNVPSIPKPPTLL